MKPIGHHIPKKETVKGLLSSRISGYRKNCSTKNQTHSIDGRKMTETKSISQNAFSSLYCYDLFELVGLQLQKIGDPCKISKS
jgi:hypothetical protein